MRIDGISNIFDFNIENTYNKGNNALFSDYLKSALESANEAQIKADEESKKLMTGETKDIHQALIAAEEARLQMELVVQIRNKLVESYQEVSRMQI